MAFIKNGRSTNIELNDRQQVYFDLFDKKLQDGTGCIISSYERQWGKTTIVNEIGFTYQALGYQVFLLTKFPQSNEHFANKYVASESDICGIGGNKCIAIIDEYDIKNYADSSLLDCLEYCNIPCVGFWN